MRHQALSRKTHQKIPNIKRYILFIKEKKKLEKPKSNITTKE